MSNNQETKANVTTTDDNSSVQPITRELVESLAPTVRLTDSDLENNLDLFCYIRCSPEDSDVIKNCRGVIFHGNDLVLKSFPYTEELNNEQVEEIQKKCVNLTECQVFKSYEGALLRIFNYNGKWYVTTHRKLDAFHSKWASRHESFGSTFQKALEAEFKEHSNFLPELMERLKVEPEEILQSFMSTLNPEKQYMFLVLNTAENRIVCQAPTRPTVFHVGTRNKNGEELSFDENVGLPYPEKLHFDTVEQLTTYVKNADPTSYQGVVVFTKDGDHFKVLNTDYQELFQVRGNEPSIKFRYLQLRMDKTKGDKLYWLYPKYADKFDEYENTLYEIAKNIYKSYVARYIPPREYVARPKEEFLVMDACHKEYMETRQRISVRKVIEVLNQQPATNLNRMIRRFNTETQTDSQPMNNAPINTRLPSMLNRPTPPIPQVDEN